MTLSVVTRKKFVLFVFALLLTSLVNAQDGFYVIPSVSVAEIYDDNIFFTIDDEDDDLATRISPAIEAGYESQTAQWNARYSFDAEKYNEFTDLDSNMIRRVADLAMSVQTSTKLTLAGDAHYIKTNTPVDLTLGNSNFIQGLSVGRVAAERLSIHPELAYQFTPQTMGSLQYTLTNDKLFGALDSDTHLVETALEHQLSDKNTAEFGYNYRRYQFDQVPVPGSSGAIHVKQDTHTPWIGLQHDFSQRTSLTGRVGPRIFDSSTDIYALLLLNHTFANGDLLISYERNDTTLLGEVGRLEADTFSAAFTWRGGRNFEIGIAPGYAKISRDDFKVDIYSAALNASYRINDALYLNASYDLNYQNVNFVDGREEDVSRNVILLGFTLTYPRRTEPQTP